MSHSKWLNLYLTDATVEAMVMRVGLIRSLSTLLAGLCAYGICTAWWQRVIEVKISKERRHWRAFISRQSNGGQQFSF